MSLATPHNLRNALQFKAADLARSAGPDWPPFLEAFKSFAHEQTLACVGAPADQVQVAQGRARLCNELATLFADAVKVADRVQRRS
jgi:hypothetical protein